MPHITTVLGNEVGIQFQGVQDKSSSTGEFPVVGLFIGQFRRGRFDKPMTIHKGNIKAILGYDPNNPDYAAVSDALAAGLPSVQVVRLKKNQISCAGATPYVFMQQFMNDLMFRGNLEVNGVLIESGESSIVYKGYELEANHIEYLVYSGILGFGNLSYSDHLRCIYYLHPQDQNTEIVNYYEGENSSAYYDKEMHAIIFCLSPRELA